jgi:hypothetical protein
MTQPTEPLAPPSDEQREAKALDWLIHGGNGHEDGKDGLRALMIPGNLLPEYLGAYEEYLDEARQAAASQPELDGDKRFTGKHGSLKNHPERTDYNDKDYDALAHPERKEADELCELITKWRFAAAEAARDGRFINSNNLASCADALEAALGKTNPPAAKEGKDNVPNAS